MNLHRKSLTQPLWRLLVVLLIALVVLVGCSEDSNNTTASGDNVAIVEDNDAGTSNESANPNPPQRISPAAYQEEFGLNADNHLLLDVRTPEEFNSGHIPGAENIAVQELARRLNEVPADQPIIIYCRSGNRSAQAAQILYSAGYGDVYDMGGIIDWQAAGLPVQ
ncbi:MAG: rhodanese-like domain-containing protein [Anaerolineales bacterium]